MISLSSIVGKNEDLIPHAMNIYAKEGDAVADVTFGMGNFWKKVDTSIYKFFPSDIKTGIDFRNLPYKNNSINALILDPPYMHGSPTPIKEEYDKTYLNNKKGGWGADYVYQLYFDGIKEAYRVLAKKGILMVKCQDQVESGKNCFDHIVIYNQAIELGFTADDLFILTRIGIPMMRHKYQKHARKNHSYLWVFRK